MNPFKTSPLQLAISKRIGNSALGFIHNHVWCSVWAPTMRHVDDAVRHGLKHNVKDCFESKMTRTVRDEIKWRVKRYAG